MLVAADQAEVFQHSFIPRITEMFCNPVERLCWFIVHRVWE
jgi:hypothetical protein